jgi:hypothetical protein
MFLYHLAQIRGEVRPYPFVTAIRSISMPMVVWAPRRLALCCPFMMACLVYCLTLRLTLRVASEYRGEPSASVCCCMANASILRTSPLCGS